MSLISSRLAPESINSHTRASILSNIALRLSLSIIHIWSVTFIYLSILLFPMGTFNDSGIAYGIGVLMIFLVSCTAIMIAFTPMINGIIAQHNTQVEDGSVSEQRKNSTAFSVTIWNGLPIWMLIGGFVWAIIRALEVRESG